MTRKLSGIVCDGCRKVASDEKAVIQKSTPWRDELHFCSRECQEEYSQRMSRKSAAPAEECEHEK